ncbi:MAG: hypothetical protein MZV70_07930 [Desulfobacterales bacterium]|nr:hypothetical protein [Desulfobacterales bacterium]
MGRAADVRPARLRARPREGAGAAASRVEDAGSRSRPLLAGDMKARRRRGRAGRCSSWSWRRTPA